MLNIKEAMANGMTREDIMAMMDSAEAELAAEAAVNTELDKLREEAVIAVMDYARVAGLLPEDLVLTGEDMTDILKTIKEMEDEIRTRLSFLNVLRGIAPKHNIKAAIKPKAQVVKVETPEEAEDVLQKFLESL